MALAGTNATSISTDDYLWLIALLEALKGSSSEQPAGPGVKLNHNVSIVPVKKVILHIASNKSIATHPQQQEIVNQA